MHRPHCAHTRVGQEESALNSLGGSSVPGPGLFPSSSNFFRSLQFSCFSAVLECWPKFYAFSDRKVCFFILISLPLFGIQIAEKQQKDLRWILFMRIKSSSGDLERKKLLNTKIPNLVHIVNVSDWDSKFFESFLVRFNPLKVFLPKFSSSPAISSTGFEFTSDSRHSGHHSKGIYGGDLWDTPSEIQAVL